MFNLLLQTLQGVVCSIFKLMGLSLSCPNYSLISR
ncbi:transposase [Serratia marcescens]|nr:transposase [Serratia marcescens]MBN5333880.1 transposase [Serratia marcescens]MBN5339464.1 transposase [Serratia marcescens]HAT2882592.1 hypothetical protein [Serratia marcescens]HEJ7131356.1 transposase [Serratia marcescens]